VKPLLALLIAGSFLSAGLWSADDEVELKKEEVPAAVLETMQKAAAGAALDEFEKETKKGAVVFTATFVGKDKKEMEVTVDAQGKLVSVEAEDDEDDKKDGKDHKDEKDDDKDEKKGDKEKHHAK
jgi:antitoxin component YwqK of YwqJK toxin-antitoxin module